LHVQAVEAAAKHSDRNLEDFVTWVDDSKLKRSIMKYRDKLDDFDLM
jgi:U3 small nucleolar ribonucleoprotein protein IMP3